MNNKDNSANDEEQLATVPMDYRALLAMTRPLVITEDAPLSLRGGEVFRSGFGISPEPADWRADFTLRRGEFLRPDLLGPRMGGDEGMATRGERAGTRSGPEGECDVVGESISVFGQTGLNLELRIHLGMS